MACKWIRTTDVRYFTLPLSLSCFSAGLSHQPSDGSGVQPLHHRHGQLPVELQNVSAGHGPQPGGGPAAQEQSATILGELRPRPPPRLHELRGRLPPQGECLGCLLKTFELDHFPLQTGKNVQRGVSAGSVKCNWRAKGSLTRRTSGDSWLQK